MTSKHNIYETTLVDRGVKSSWRDPYLPLEVILRLDSFPL
jgi:hypothetical protein